MIICNACGGAMGSDNILWNSHTLVNEQGIYHLCSDCRYLFEKWLATHQEAHKDKTVASQLRPSKK